MASLACRQKAAKDDGGRQQTNWPIQNVSLWKLLIAATSAGHFVKKKKEEDRVFV